MRETQETRIGSLGQEDPLEKEVATHASILTWGIPRKRSWQATVYGIAKGWTQMSKQASKQERQDRVSMFKTDFF